MILAALLAFSTGAAAQTLKLVPIVSGLDKPVAITHAGDARLFITLQSGQVVIHDGTSLVPELFLDIRPLVSCCGERGLLSIAFHPRYQENGRFFVYYTNRNGDLVIARYAVSQERDRADPVSATILMTIPHPGQTNHNGGQLQFGPDGYLYVGTGDGGGAGDVPDNAQNLSVLLGKLLRIDVDSAQPYAVPPSNPFVGRSGIRPEIWAYGLRNPWRFSFDRINGDLWIGDVGQALWEEIDVQMAGLGAGSNYGWRRREGAHCFNPSSGCSDASLVDPLFEYSHSEGCSITGGYRYRGTRATTLAGKYLYGDFCSGSIWALSESPSGSWTSQKVLATSLGITTFGEDMTGELYVADSKSGKILQIVQPPAPRRRVVPHS